MEKPLKMLLAEMKAKKFKKEDEEITVHLFADGVLIKLIKVLICLAVGIELIDKLNPTVKCHPIGRTWKNNKNANAAKNIRDYNYQQFVNVFCETDISDYTNHHSYQAWKNTCPPPAGTGKTGRCSKDLIQENDPAVQNCSRELADSLLEIFRSKKTSMKDVFNYLIMSFKNPDKIYDCRPRTLYYYYMSWTILIYALIIGLGPTVWNVLYGRKIVDRIRHVKDFIDTIVDEDAQKKKEMIGILHAQVKTWNTKKMMIVSIFKAVVTLIVTIGFIILFFRGFRNDIENLAYTVCKVHNYEYAKCASARVGLIQFVWLFTTVILFMIAMFCIKNLFTLTFTGNKDNLFLVNLLKKQLDIDVFGEDGCCTGCCSDLVLLSIICERNRNLFGRAWRKFNRRMSMGKKLRWKNKLESNIEGNRESVL